MTAGWRRCPRILLLVVLVVLLAAPACQAVSAHNAAELSGPPPTTTIPEPPPPPPRAVVEEAYTPFATVGGIVLVHPAARVERIGFHQANHDGARNLEPLPTAAAPATMEVRQRLTDPRTAADVVVDPEAEIRSPVTGTVKWAGTYVLYCKHSDDYVVIEPDSRPGWEVKVLHIDGVQVRSGQRVVAGETVIAPRATQLPFESQVDKFRTADPAWPHVHIEVVDPSIPDIPSPGGGCT
jgi:biotin carboxyl carrier protein